MEGDAASVCSSESDMPATVQRQVPADHNVWCGPGWGPQFSRGGSGPETAPGAAIEEGLE